MMTVAAHYAWTIRAKGRQDILRVTTLLEMRDVLRILELPGTSPIETIIRDDHDADFEGRGLYTHNGGGDDEWSLTWTRVDQPTVEH